MAQSPDHPELLYIQAKGFNTGRPDGKPLWIVIHDMEASETATRAENTAAYFANPSDGRSVSSHYCVDNNSVVQCVRLKDVAWTVGNRPGNNRGINWELSGFASQSRGQWLDDFGLSMFAQMAPIVRSDAEKYGIPLVKRTVAELKAWVPGVTSHNDLRIAFGTTTHTDPGTNFPWDKFLEIMNSGSALPGKEEAMAQVFLWQGNIWISRGGAMQREKVCPLPAGTTTSPEANVVTDAHQVYPGQDGRKYPTPDLKDRGWNEALVDLTFGKVAGSSTIVIDYDKLGQEIAENMPPVGEVDLSDTAKSDVDKIVRTNLDKTKLGS